MSAYGDLSSFHFVKSSKACLIINSLYKLKRLGNKIHPCLTPPHRGKPLPVTYCYLHCVLLVGVETCNEFIELLWNPHICEYPSKMVILGGIVCFCAVYKAHDQWMIILSSFSVMWPSWLTHVPWLSLKLGCCGISSASILCFMWSEQNFAHVRCQENDTIVTALSFPSLVWAEKFPSSNLLSNF